MKNTRVKKRPVAAEAIALMADKGRDVSRFFGNSGEMQLHSASGTYARLRKLRGKVRFTRTLAELKADR